MTVQALRLPLVGTARAESPALFNRNFLLLWQAQVVSQFGNQAFTIAMAVWTIETTRSATMSGLMVMAGILPLVLLAPLTGTFVDRRRSRVQLVAACDLASGALMTLLVLGFLAGPAAWRPLLLLGIAIGIGVCNAFFDPAVNALVPELVPRNELERANAFRQGSRQVTNLTAQSVGGILYGLVGPAVLFLINGVSFLFAGASELLIRSPRERETAPLSLRALRAPRETVTFWNQAADGFRFVAAQPGMLGFMAITAIFNALLMPISLLLPVLAGSFDQAGPRWYGFLLASINAGAVLGCTVIGTLRSRLSGRSRRWLLVTALATLALALAALGQVRSPWMALVIAAATGALSSGVNVIVLSLVQRRTSDELRGRVLGLYATMTRILVPVGLLAGGTIADLTGRNVPLVYGACGAMALISVLVLAGRRNTWTFLASS